MSAVHQNTQMFALSRPPPTTIELARRRYRLVQVFKHDFFAATCLYEATRQGSPARIVVKFPRTQGFCGLPMSSMGRLMRAREEAMYRALVGVAGVPRWLGRVGAVAYAIEHIDGEPLDHVEAPPAGFFDRLRRLFDDMHARGVAYVDANKLSNIIVSGSGEPFVVDYQISIRTREGWPWPLRAVVGGCVRYLQRCDLYHLYKHKRRLCPAELTPTEARLSHRRGGLHNLHRGLTTPWRTLRRASLRRQCRNGRLVSPTDALEDHDQPEKATWRPGPGEQ